MELHDDDKPIGRLLSRREILTLMGAAGAAVLVGCGPATTETTATSAATTAAGGVTAAPSVNAEAASAAALESNPSAVASQVAEVGSAEAANTVVATPSCIVRPEVTEGPYYVDVDLVRSDIRSDPTTNVVKEGAPLVLTFNVSQVSGSTCTVLPNAEVEIWHCDAAGDYSAVSDPGFNTTDVKWLRGTQVTDANGVATFTTIYPGWYSGRCVHIHFKVRPTTETAFTSQLFFDDALSQQVFTQAPYLSNGSVPDTLNATDSIYQDLLLLTTTQTADGYAATFPIGIDLSTIGSGESSGGGGPGGPPPGGTRGPRPGTTTTAP